jgi:elongator complex protein 1
LFAVTHLLIVFEFLYNEQVVLPVDEHDDHKVRVYFNASGSLHLISLVDSEKKCRRMRIYNLEGDLECTSEDCSGLRSLASWHPISNLIATVVQQGNETRIQFFEKNGLMFNHFDLKTDTIPAIDLAQNRLQIDQLSWSTDGSCLLVCGHVAEDQHYMWLYTTKNYHWYCKQILCFDSILDVFWHTERPLHLRVIQKGGEIEVFRFCRQVDRNSSTVVVIDGNRLLITPIDYALIPPPMCAYELQFDQQINECTLNDAKLLIRTVSNQIHLITAEKMVDSFEANESRPFSIRFQAISYKQPNRPAVYSKCETIDDLTAVKGERVFHCKWIHDDVVAFARLTSDDSESKKLNQYKTDSTRVSVFRRKNTKFELHQGPTSIRHVTAIDVSGKDRLVVQSDQGQVQMWNFSDDKVQDLHKIESCEHLSAVVSFNDRLCVIQHTETRRNLYLNGQTIATGSCTSFLVHENRFVLYTTTDHQLKCIDLNKSDQLASPALSIEMGEDESGTFKRIIERGGRLIASTNVEGRVVLQMPRGNLEIISPRILLLHLIEVKLTQKSYGSAFKLMKKHRINLNLLVDRDINDFLNNASKFISDLSLLGDQEICLFLSEICNQNVTKSLYPYFYEPSKSEESDGEVFDLDGNGSKLDRVCVSLRTSMQQADEKRFFIPILLTYIKKNEPEVGLVLRMVHQAATDDLRQSAVTYLKYLIDVNVLFDEALGTYDLDTALMVAYQSNKDPKEFLPLIDTFRQMEPVAYRQFRIDSHLKRYASAVRNLCSLDNVNEHLDELLRVVEKQKLYFQAIELLKLQPEAQRQVWSKYAEYLLNKKYLDEALYAFKQADDYAMATKTAQLSGDWRQAIRCACRHYGTAEVRAPQHPTLVALLRTLADNLAANNQHSDAALIWSLHLRDTNQSIQVLIDGHCWDQVFEQIDLNDLSDLKERAKTQMLEHFNQLRSNVQTLLTSLTKYSQRLPLARANKLKTDAFYGMDNGFDFDDNASMCSASSSGSSDARRSQRGSSKANSLATNKSHSNKSARRNLKKYQLREGTANEHLALVHEIRQNLINADLLKNEVKSLLRHLFDYKFFAEAKQLQSDFDRLAQQMTRSVQITWTDLTLEQSKNGEPRYTIEGN